MRWPFILRLARDAGDGGNATAGLILILFFLTVSLFLYFIPSLVAHRNRKINAPAIFALNLLLGWTLVGWVVALVWAIAKEDKDLRGMR